MVGAIASEYDTVAESLEAVAGAALALNIAAMAVSYAMSRLARLDSRQSTAIALGVHNSTLAIAVGATLAAELTIPAAVYSSFMVVTGGALPG